MLFFLFSYMFSYTIIQYVKMRSDNDELYAGDEDFFVFRVSVWICCCSLSVSIGAVTLLPFSVLGSEVLERYPDNYYLKWLNASLINSLWNYVFMLSNLSLFVLLPFSYFFIESQGFSSAAFHLHVVQPFHGSTPASVRRPLLARFYETVVVCSLVIIVLIGIADVFYSHLFLQPSYISLSLLSLSLSLSTPLLYSFASLFGVSLLLLSVPLGFAKMFDVFSEMLITQKTTIRSNTSRYRSATTLNNGDLPTHLFKATTPERLQALSCLRRDTKFQQFQQQKGYSSRVSAPFLRHRSVAELSSISTTNGTGEVFRKGSVNYKQYAQKAHQRSKYAKIDFGKCFHARKRLHHLLEPIKILLTLLKYPIIMLILLVLTVLTVSMVLLNTLQLLFGFRALPAYVQYMEQYRHTLGIFGALGEIAIILYIMMSSLVGVYSVPLIRRLQPRRGRTSMTAIIINCVIILVLSSALPVLVRTLGITTFDLLGNYGRIHWISNFSLVWGYNLLFAAASMLCLVNKFTQPVRRELFRRFTTLAGQKHFTYDTLRASSSPLSDIYTDFEDNDSPEND
uniref:Protein LMBR1L n=1 Tax=Globodera pallida TaxID=36090 RepID=A0A183BPM6_GLOPA